MNKYSSNHNRHLKMVAELLQTGSYLDAQVSSVLKEFGITHIQFNVLRILEGVSPAPLSAGEINNRILFVKTDLTRLIDRLQKKEFVERKTCLQNRRKIEITITKTGKDLIKKALPLIEEKLEGFYNKKITKKECDELIRIVQKIKD